RECEYKRSRGEQGGRRELRRGRERQRRRANRQMQVEFVELGRVLRVRERCVENLQDLIAAQLPRVVVNLDLARNRPRLVLFDSEDRHQIPFDCLAKLTLAVKYRILELQASGAIELDLPTGLRRRHARVRHGTLAITRGGSWAARIVSFATRVYGFRRA